MNQNVMTRSGIRYSAEIRTKDREKMIEWCTKTFGEPKLITGRWALLDWTVQFKSEEDRTMFILKWGL